MKNILILNYEFPPLGGGAGNATRYLLKEYANQTDYRFTLVTSSTSKFRIENPAGNVKIIFLDIHKRGSLHYQRSRDLLNYSWKAWRFCYKWIKQNQCDLIHAFFGVPCGLIALLLGKPYIISLRGSDVPFYNDRFYWLDRLILQRLHGFIWKKAAKVIANSADLKALAHKSFPDQEIDVIPNGVDTEEFSPVKRGKIHGRLQLVSTGRLIKRKGYSILIEALNGLNNVTLTLIGSGYQKESLDALAKRFMVDVKFLGRVDHQDLPYNLNKADVFVLPSFNEGMSNSVLEAMGCGLPIIITATGGAEELINGNGTIVHKHNVKALRETILKYLKHPKKITEEGKVSRQIAEKMSWHSVSDAYINQYNKIL